MAEETLKEIMIQRLPDMLTYENIIVIRRDAAFLSELLTKKFMAIKASFASVGDAVIVRLRSGETDTARSVVSIVVAITANPRDGYLAVIRLADRSVAKVVLRDWSLRRAVAALPDGDVNCVVCGEDATTLTLFENRGYRPVCNDHEKGEEGYWLDFQG